MLPDPFEADPGELRAAGARLDATAERVAGTVAQAPPLVVTAPGWTASVAVGDLERAAATLFGALAADVELAAAGFRRAAGRYADADARAAARFRGGLLLAGPFPGRSPRRPPAFVGPTVTGPTVTWAAARTPTTPDVTVTAPAGTAALDGGRFRTAAPDGGRFRTGPAGDGPAPAGR